MPITALPTPPLRSDGPDTFADRGDTFMAALPAFVTQANALEVNVALDAAAVIAVAPGAVAAANFKGEYAAGTTYQVGHSASYLGDTWFAKTINTGVTPVTGANWQRVVAIPIQTGQSGKVLTTDGSNPSWQPVPAELPSQASHSGKFLTTNGTSPIWGAVTGFADLSTAQTLTNKTIHGNTNTLTADGTNAVGFRGLPQVDITTGYTLVLSDAGKHIYKGGSSASVTIPANSSVAFPIGTVVTLINNGTNQMNITITTDTLRQVPSGTTGTRILAQYGTATITKVTATLWMISGSGLT